eukprot:m.351263 g.351263  ORF g.351263 m.351263 type:complete len:595 (+) comp19896_c1_seq8:1418-3202(+)
MPPAAAVRFTDHISNLNPFTFGNLFVGKTLNLSHNNITKLPAMVFRRVVVGSVLDLSYNQLAEMEGKTFFGLNAAEATVQLADNRLTSIAEAFFGIGGPSAVNLNNNNVSVLEPQWFVPLSMNVVMHMYGNPSQCRVTVLEQVTDVVECTCAPGTAGNGRFCSREPCLRQLLESQAQVKHGRFVCDTMVDNFEDCTLVCDSGYQPQDGPARCFGGEWGSPTNVPYVGQVGTYPTCTPEPGHLDVGAVVGGVLGALGVLLIVAFVYRRRVKKVLFSTQVELSLQERLLAETQQTVVALKQGWRVLPQEIRLLHRLDEGAVGEVWQGLWNDLPVAVKSLKKAHFFGDMDDSFQTEVEFLMTLRHPNVVLFFGSGTWDGSGSFGVGLPFLLTEYLARGSLRHLLASEQELSWDLRCCFVRDAAAGLAFLHSLDCVHRDVKSGNLLVSLTWTVKVADFGTSKLLKAIDDVPPTRKCEIAHDAGSHSRYNTQFMGSPPWMAPEIVLGGKRPTYDASCDVYRSAMVDTRASTFPPSVWRCAVTAARHPLRSKTLPSRSPNVLAHRWSLYAPAQCCALTRCTNTRSKFVTPPPPKLWDCVL